MSFALKNLKKEKRPLFVTAQSSFIENVILGDDLASVLKLVKLKNFFGPEKLRLYSNKLLNKAYLIENFEYKMSSFNSLEQIKPWMNIYPDLKFDQCQTPSVFYKDGKWHEFTGRAKPMDLLSGEKSFIAPRIDLNLESLFNQNDWENLDEILKSYSEVCYLEKIEASTPSDLVDKDFWKLTFKDLNVIKTTNLIMNYEKKNFLKASHDGVNLPSEISQVLVAAEPFQAVSVAFSTKIALFDTARTYFIPQSFTHEWGHYIVEQKKTNLTIVSFIIHHDEPNPEEVAMKIKHMKRVMDRIVPNFEQNILNESIIACDEMWLSSQSNLPHLDNIELLPSFNALTL